MKKILPSIMLFTLLCVGCSKDDGASNLTSASKYLSSINVTDANSIYKQSSLSASSVASRSGDVVTGETYYKIDYNGESSQLVFTGESDGAVNVAIDNIYKLGSRLLYVIPNSSDLWALSVDTTYSHCIVDIETGKIYLIPISLANTPIVYSEVSNGDVYFSATNSSSLEQMLYKIDITNFTISEVVNFSGHLLFTGAFEALNNGNLAMDGEGGANTAYEYILTSDGVVIPTNFTDENSFVLNGDLYSYTCELDNYTPLRSTISKIVVSGNTCSEEVIIKRDAENGDGEVFRPFTTRYFYNSLKKCYICVDLLASSDSNRYYEFYGDRIEKITTITDDVGLIINTSSGWMTSDSWWYSVNDGSNIIKKTSMQDYSVKEVDISGSYIVAEATSSTEGTNITFTAMSYNQETIIGTIDVNNNITTATTQSPELEIADLIPLN